jgi:HNH endonuclease
MKYEPPFSPGQEVSFDDIRSIVPQASFGGGMLYSNNHKCLILLSKHDSLYEDEWRGNVLHYTGTGRSGDQDINYRENKNLAESQSPSNRLPVYLFESSNRIYTYRGEVHLSGKPYQATKPDKDGLMRKVWIFPLSLDSGGIVSKEYINEYEKEKKKQVKKLSVDQLKNQAVKSSSKTSSYRQAISKQYTRNQSIARYTKLKANGVCELCEKPAPFFDKDGEPYLESHHVLWLERGGADSINNTVALCPNCHKKMHVVEDKNDFNKLYNIAKKRAKESGYGSAN